MQRRLIAAVAVAAVAAGAVVALRERSSAEHWQVVDRYCLGCHNETDLAGGLALDAVDRADVARDAAVWEAVVRKLRTGLMPPKGEPRPERGVLDGVAATTRERARLGRRARAEPRREAARALEPHGVRQRDSGPARVRRARDCGHAAARRLGRRLRQHRRRAQRVADLARSLCARGDADRPARRRRPHDGARRDALRGCRRLGAAAAHRRPAARHARRPGRRTQLSARRRVRADRAGRVAGGRLGQPDGAARVLRRPERRARLQRRARRARRAAARAAARAGGPAPHHGRARRRAALRRRQRALRRRGRDRRRRHGARDRRAVRRERRRRHAEPPRDLRLRAASAAEETPCAGEILTRLATRAYRRPVPTASDEVQLLLEFYRLGREEGGDFESGIQYALSRLLVDPNFLYRFEREPADVAVGGVYAISDLELASRLSFFLWSSIPDDELLAVAAAGDCTSPPCSRRRSSDCSPTNARSGSSRTSPASG